MSRTNSVRLLFDADGSMREEVFKSGAAGRDGDKCVAAKMRVSGVLSCDRESDTSETNTFGSHEENGDPSIVEDKFRVDRKKLEKMLEGTEGENRAEEFFKTIMTRTETVISWPSKIKIGGKSKKDPFVKATGKVEAVKRAKDLVMAELDIETDRVTLKMDVPYTDHSHIIGKGGSNTQRVMKDTDCHIHFPDSNKKNSVEKSNLVSIAGHPPQVERARALIRDLVPLCLTFQVPIQVDVSHSFVRHVQDAFAVSVHVRHHNPNAGEPYVSTVMVRANEADAEKVKAATRTMLQNLGSAEKVSLTMVIAPQHHASVCSNNNIAVISRLTGTKITFPETDEYKKGTVQGTVAISGSIEGVHSARQKIIGALPLFLLFDLGYDQADEFDKPLNNQVTDKFRVLVNQVMDRFGVVVTTKPKVKNSTRSIIISGHECKVGDLFEARRCLLKLEFTEPSVPTFVPATYHFSAIDLMAVRASNLTPPLIPPKMLGWNELSSSYVPAPALQYRPIRGANNVYGGRAASVCSNSTTSTLSSPTRSPTHGSPIAHRFGTEAVSDKDYTTDRLVNTSNARLQELIGIGATRVPTNSFVGYGFSQSMPVPSEQKTNRETEKRNSIATTGHHYDLLDSVGPARAPIPVAVNNFRELSDTLVKIGCENYVELFREQEVDMDTFLKLDECDLVQLGVPTFGARRRMMELIKNRLRFSVAPGAERRAAFCSAGNGNRVMHCGEDPWNSTR